MYLLKQFPQLIRFGFDTLWGLYDDLNASDVSYRISYIEKATSSEDGGKFIATVDFILDFKDIRALFGIEFLEGVIDDAYTMSSEHDFFKYCIPEEEDGITFRNPDGSVVVVS